MKSIAKKSPTLNDIFGQARDLSLGGECLSQRKEKTEREKKHNSPGAAADLRAQHKREKYEDRCREAGFEFSPLISEDTGFIHKSVHACVPPHVWWFSHFHPRVSHLGDPED